ncbi:hypothetical protein ABT084_15615 [Streptomyces sp. NPDC002138]|uniref:hypothetical protein n=1 Tax=Streptomyces sp. NPDC002138 TaxID=3154410 RepID=UPI003317B745
MNTFLNYLTVLAVAALLLAPALLGLARERRTDRQLSAAAAAARAGAAEREEPGRDRVSHPGSSSYRTAA